MATYVIIGIIAGLTAAALYATVFAGAAVALLMFYIAPLPLFIAGLGWGSVSAIAGAIAGAAALAIAIDPKFGAVFAITVALAPVVLSHLALKSRQVSSSEDAGIPTKEWYPEGRLVVWTAGLAILLVAATLILTGLGPEQLSAVLNEMMGKMAELKVDKTPMGPELQAQMNAFVERAALFIPAISASIWVVANLVNLLLAAKILTRSGRSVRDWEPFRNLVLPQSTALALALALICAFLMSGLLGLIAKTAALSLLTVMAILGLATFHYLVRDQQMRITMLTGVYFLIFAFSGIGMLPLIALALAELIFGLRARKSRSLPPNPS